MPDIHALLTEAYAAFNRRDIDAALALMTDTVHWPKASEGGHAIGKEAIHAYWTRQWSEFNPHVEPLEITETAPGKAVVRVHQLVKDLKGNMLSDTEVHHTYTVLDGQITRMDLTENTTVADSTPSAAFSKHQRS